METFDLNLGALAAGAAIHFVVPAIWYAPALMGNRWMKLLDKPEGYWETRQTPQVMRLAFGSYLVASVITAFVFFHFVAAGTSFFDSHGFEGGAVTGWWLWLGSMATDVGAYGFEGRSWKLWPIDKLDRLISWTVLCGTMAAIAGL